jgi:Thioredoxin-like domain
MKGRKLHNLPMIFAEWQRFFVRCLLLLTSLFFLIASPAYAGINDDNYEGSVYVLYAGNGSLVPPRISLADALAQKKPTVMVFYVDNSKDCKQYSVVVSRIQAFYGRAAEIIPINVDNIFPQDKYSPTEPGYYYSGGVPQVVIFDKSGKVVLNKKGQVPYEEIDDRLREVFDLLPRQESVELKRRSFNEISTELTE